MGSKPIGGGQKKANPISKHTKMSHLVASGKKMSGWTGTNVVDDILAYHFSGSSRVIEYNGLQLLPNC